MRISEDLPESAIIKENPSDSGRKKATKQNKTLNHGIKRQFLVQIYGKNKMRNTICKAFRISDC